MSTEPKADSHPIITTHSSEFKLDAYTHLSPGEMAVFVVHVLQTESAPVAVEEIVSTCFRFFPHSFALKNYFYWPDSALVTRRLHDAKEKGLLKGNATDGYETKAQGRQVAKQVAKALGVSLPARPKVEASALPVEEKEEIAPSAPVTREIEKQETRKKEVRQKQKATKPEKKAVTKKSGMQANPGKESAARVIKTSAPEPREQAKTAPKKTVNPVVNARVEFKQKPGKAASRPKTPVKPVVKHGKKQGTKKEGALAAKQEIKKATPKGERVVEKNQNIKKKQAKASAQPGQLTISLTPPKAWKKAETPAPKPKVKNEALPAVAASKEEKEKAAKVIKQVERSDAFRLYRVNGKRAQIGEFDFRNMLFATMESSPETLKRNLDLFKRYAGIHFRADVIAFLDFCEAAFTELMKPKAKIKR
ncbi:MAG: hypothetical protein HXY38_07810 [Chloroflexi bacterium]|nr:hypothetical protein [Chloroflexota bacterium]